MTMALALIAAAIFYLGICVVIVGYRIGELAKRLAPQQTHLVMPPIRANEDEADD